jgi:osmotically-inducible protein OsmY
MAKHSWARIFAIPSVFVGLACALPAQEPSGSADKPKADNTRVNKQEEPTADQAKNNSSDRELARKIRSAVIDDKSLSTYGHNVKIIARNGKVTLKGPVHSDDEKQSIEAKAVEVAGAGNVTNQITVKGDKSADKTADHQ